MSRQEAAEKAGDMDRALELGVPQLNVRLRLHLSVAHLLTRFSYKPQKISPKFQGTVRQLLHKKIRESYIHPQFVTDVMKPMSIEQYVANMCMNILSDSCRIMDNGVQTLSGGELQRVAIVLALGTPADIYLVYPRFYLM